MEWVGHCHVECAAICIVLIGSIADPKLHDSHRECTECPQGGGMMGRKEAPMLSHHGGPGAVICPNVSRFDAWYSTLHMYCSKFAAGRCLLSVKIAGG